MSRFLTRAIERYYGVVTAVDAAPTMTMPRRHSVTTAATEMVAAVMLPGRLREGNVIYGCGRLRTQLRSRHDSLLGCVCLRCDLGTHSFVIRARTEASV